MICYGDIEAVVRVVAASKFKRSVPCVGRTQAFRWYFLETFLAIARNSVEFR